MSWGVRLAHLAVVAGLAVGILYLPQPLLTLIAEEFNVSDLNASWAAISIQLGYAAGVITLIPLSDRLAPRIQVQTQALATAGFLLLAAFAPNLWLLCIALALAGVTATIAQILLPVAVNAAPVGKLGATNGTMAGAFTISIFGGRIIAGMVGEAFGWRIVFAAAAVVMVATVPLIRRATPAKGSESRESYLGILMSLPRLALSNPTLRYMALIQFCLFASFQALWIPLVLHFTADPLAWTVASAGLIGIVGLIAGGLTLFSGRLVDRFGASTIVGACLFITLIGLVAIAILPNFAPIVLLALFAVTLAVQTSQSGTQSRSLQTSGAGKAGRANTIYMFGLFLGGSFGGGVGALVFTGSGYGGVSFFAASLVLIGVVIHLVGARKRVL